MIWKRRITDVKRSGVDGKCDKCRKHQDGLIRVTFEGPFVGLNTVAD